MNRVSFLRELDTAIWVEKRLFPSRLLVLDRIESTRKSEEFVREVLQQLVLSYGESQYLECDFVEMALAMKRPATESQLPESMLAQFLSDITTFGLREALAYIFEYPDYLVGKAKESLANKKTQDFMLKGYANVGQRFLGNQNKVEQILRQTFSSFIKNKGSPLPDLLDRLIVADAIGFGDPWADGQLQHNLAKIKPE